MAYGDGSFRRQGGGGFHRGGGGFRRDFGPREMHKIKCANCGKDDEVPFKPREGTPVYCRDCFAKRSGRTSRGRETEKTEEAETEKSETTESE